MCGKVLDTRDKVIFEAQLYFAVMRIVFNTFASDFVENFTANWIVMKC